MKTQYSKILMFLLLGTMYNISMAQHLFVDGRFFNDHGKIVTAKYTLMCDHKVIKTGRRRKIKVDLSLNKDYTLVISKEGCNTRSINLSTKTLIEDDFVFAFDVVLRETKTEGGITNTFENSNVVVYYDAKMNAFNYSCNNKK